MPRQSLAISLLMVLAVAFACPTLAQDEHYHTHKHRHHHHGRSHKHGHHHKHRHSRHAGAGVKSNDVRQPVSKSRNRTCKTAPCFRKHPSGHYTTPLKKPQKQDTP